MPSRKTCSPGAELRSDGVWWYPHLDMASYVLHRLSAVGSDWALSMESGDSVRTAELWERYSALWAALQHAVQYGLGE